MKITNKINPFIGNRLQSICWSLSFMTIEWNTLQNPTASKIVYLLCKIRQKCHLKRTADVNKIFRQVFLQKIELFASKKGVNLKVSNWSINIFTIFYFVYFFSLTMITIFFVGKYCGFDTNSNSFLIHI